MGLRGRRGVLERAGVNNHCRLFWDMGCKNGSEFMLGGTYSSTRTGRKNISHSVKVSPVRDYSSVSMQTCFNLPH